MQPGDIVCFKTTGELAVVLYVGLEDKNEVDVRRPIMTENGIKQEVTTCFTFELETPEGHLRREAQEMILKMKIQQEVQKQLAELEKDKPVLELVN